MSSSEQSNETSRSNGAVTDRLGSNQGTTLQPTVLKYPRADRSPHRLGSINTATTLLDNCGLAELKATLFAYVCDSFEQRQSITPPLHDLVPQLAVDAAMDMLQATSPLIAPVSTIAEFELRVRELTMLTQGAPSQYQAMVSEAVLQAVSQRFQAVLETLGTVERETPLAVQTLSRSLCDFLDRLTFPEVDASGLQQLTAAKGFLDSFSKESTALPVHKREVLTQEALHQAQNSCLVQLRSIVCVEVSRLFKSRAAQLRSESLAMANRVEKCSLHLANVQAELSSALRDATHEVTRSAEDGRLLLPGATKDQVLKSMCQAYECSSADLVTKLAHQFVFQLQQRLATQLDEEAGPLEVFRVATLADSLTVLEELIDQRLPQASLYSAIDQYGVASVVQELTAAAGPLVHLTRTNPINNIEPTHLSVLTLPPPAGDNDAKTLFKLKQAVASEVEEAGGGLLEVRESSAVGQSCHLTRSVMGYPAGAQAEIDVLAWAYVRSRKLNHCPHLFGLLPDSPDGMASEIVVEIFNQLNSEH